MKSPVYPKSVFLIMTVELCERFSFCGLRTMLSLYLRDVLGLTEKEATIAYHIFYTLCYFVPFIGAIFADSFYGRFRTIRIFSFVFVVGNILLCLGAIPSLELPSVKTTLLGLVLIGIGTGGIKPCVTVLCGEQFCTVEQKPLLERFFSKYYVMINLGGFLGMIFTPWITKNIHCFGQDFCYALGFAVSAVLMSFATIFFIVGKPFYSLRCPKSNIILQFLECMVYSLKKKLESTEDDAKEHWLDFAEDVYPPRLISDMKTVLAIIFLFIPLPLFWSLFDQLGSSWTFQVARTDGQLLGIHILPDQMQVINPILTITLIPLFNNIIYPALDTLHILENPLRRMMCGGMIAGFAFLAAGYVELNLQGVYPPMSTSRKPKLTIVNSLPCSLSVVNDLTYLDQVEPWDVLSYDNLTRSSYTFNTIVPQYCGHILFERREQCLNNFTILTQAGEDGIVVITARNKKILVHSYMEKYEVETANSKPLLTIIAININQSHGYSVKIEGNAKVETNLKMSKEDSIKRFEAIPLQKGTHQVEVSLENANVKETHRLRLISLKKETINLQCGGIYCYVVQLEKKLNGTYDVDNFHTDGGIKTNVSCPGVNDTHAIEPKSVDRMTNQPLENLTNNNESKKVYTRNNTGTEQNKYQAVGKLLELSPGRTLPLIYLLPQYVLISVAEVMFAIAGLQFSFSQAPRTMKTVTIATWHLSVAVGNVIIICIEQLKGCYDQANEFFLYAGLMFVDMLFFYRMTKKYKFVRMQLNESSSLLLTTKHNNDILFNLNTYNE